MKDRLLAFLEHDRFCVDCLAKLIHRRVEEVARMLDELSTNVHLSQQPAICSACVAVRITYKALGRRRETP